MSFRDDNAKLLYTPEFKKFTRKKAKILCVKMPQFLHLNVFGVKEYTIMQSLKFQEKYSGEKNNFQIMMSLYIKYFQYDVKITLKECLLYFVILFVYYRYTHYDLMFQYFILLTFSTIYIK